MKNKKQVQLPLNRTSGKIMTWTIIFVDKPLHTYCFYNHDNRNVNVCISLTKFRSFLSTVKPVNKPMSKIVMVASRFPLYLHTEWSKLRNKTVTRIILNYREG